MSKFLFIYLFIYIFIIIIIITFFFFLFPFIFLSHLSSHPTHSTYPPYPLPSPTRLAHSPLFPPTSFLCFLLLFFLSTSFSSKLPLTPKKKTYGRHPLKGHPSFPIPFSSSPYFLFFFPFIFFLFLSL